VRLGIPDRFVDHGSQQELYKECSFDAQSIYETAKKFVQKSNNKQVAG